MRSRAALVLTFVAAVVATPALAGFAGTDLFIPMAGRGAGAYPSNWFTTLWVYNPNASAVSVDISFLERQKNNVTTAPPKVTVSLAAGETALLENIVEDTFGKQVFGALRVQCAEKVVASVRLLSKESASAPLNQSFGQDFAAVPATFAIGLNESTEILGGYQTQPDATSEARFNIGCVETTGKQVTVRWSARDETGAEQDTYDKSVPPLSQVQGAFKDYFPAVSLTNSRLTASVISGTGEVICYGSMITNDKTLPKPVQDPTTFEMVYPDELLAANAAAGVGGSGASGQVAFWSDATTLAGTNSLFWDNGYGRLGIGTAAPAQQLDMTGNVRLPQTAAAAAAGVLFMGADRFLHGYTPDSGATNVFLGTGSGNFTMGGASSVHGTGNTAIGVGTLSATTTGYYNVASGYFGLHANTTGKYNTATGAYSLISNTEGSYNTASGDGSLYANTTGDFNTATGSQSLYHNTEGNNNTAAGAGSLSANTTGSNNTATGKGSLNGNTEGYNNTADGAFALGLNTTGKRNTASGYQSLMHNTTGESNTAIGHGSLSTSSEGSRNTASGMSSLTYTTGSDNTATGHNSLGGSTTGGSNTAVGSGSGANSISGSFNTFLGADTRAAATDLENATAIGYGAVVDASNHVRIGNHVVSQIGGQVAWSNLSDARHKSSIHDLDLGLDLILALHPVSFTVSGGDGRTDMGFLAQDVEALLGGTYGLLGIGSDPERTLSLRYTDLIAPLVKAVQEQQQEIAVLRDRIAERDALQAQVEGLLRRVQELEEARR